MAHITEMKFSNSSEGQKDKILTIYTEGQSVNIKGQTETYTGFWGKASYTVQVVQTLECWDYRCAMP